MLCILAVTFNTDFIMAKNTYLNQMRKMAHQHAHFALPQAKVLHYIKQTWLSNNILQNGSLQIANCK